MAKTAKRWAAAVASLLGLSALAAGCQDASPIDDYVQRVFDLQCQRIFSCCDAAEQARLGLGATEASCRAERALFEQLAVNAVKADLDEQLTVVDEKKLASCLATIEAASCQDYFARRDRSCEGAFAPNVENGDYCSSNLACRGGLCVDFTCTGDTRPLGAACASGEECSSATCREGQCAANPSLSACDGSRVSR